MLPSRRTAIRRRLLHWYRNHKRDLPWRRSHDPYAIWISETMLQQTQVKTVIPYYTRFLDQFPSVHHLAAAPLPQVLRQWSGLGYYRRAANLKKAAQQIVNRHDGKLPNDFAQLTALAGIGEYTAGALLSIAFGKPYAAIDGNVRRVLSRILRVTELRQLRASAAELVPQLRPGEFNQALMELGATVCAPKDQRCSACPLNSVCAGRSKPRADVRNLRGPAKSKNVIWPLAIVRRHGKILLRRRAPGALLAGLWELPGHEAAGTKAMAGLLQRALHAARLPLSHPRKIGEIRHAITYRRIRAPVYLYEFSTDHDPRLPRSHWRWIDPAGLRDLPISSMTAKAVGLLSVHEANTR